MKVRKKPLVVEARQFTDEPSAYEIAEWCGGDVFVYGAAQRRAIRIATLEGDVLALPGDWIIQGIKGEFYPCKPDIFAATYEPENPAVPLAPPEVERGKCGECGFQRAHSVHRDPMHPRAHRFSGTGRTP